jgi:uncharacterized RDD family membrane protein YckC
LTNKSGLPSLRLGRTTWDETAWSEAPPDALTEPALYDGVLWRRPVAYLVDVTLIGILSLCAWLVFGLAGILSFGALTPLGIAVLAVLPVGYHTAFLGRQGATPGMQLFDLELRSWTGRPPDYFQAFLTTVLFYASVSLTAWLVLLVALFTERRRTLHDLLAGTVMVRHDRLNSDAGPV